MHTRAILCPREAERAGGDGAGEEKSKTFPVKEQGERVGSPQRAARRPGGEKGSGANSPPGGRAKRGVEEGARRRAGRQRAGLGFPLPGWGGPGPGPHPGPYPGRSRSPEEDVGADEAAQALQGPFPAQRRRDAAAHRQPRLPQQRRRVRAGPA